MVTLPVPPGKSLFDVAAYRAAHAADSCTCGHPRQDHYRGDGATVGCHSCACYAYAYADA